MGERRDKPPFYGRVILEVTPDFPAGALPPEGYLAWHAWAEAQHKAGLRQVECPNCGLWRYPQELSALERTWGAWVIQKGKRKEPEFQTFSAFLCLKCIEPPE